MTFAATLAQIEHRPTTQDGRGIVPVIVRLTTHITDILRALLAEETIEPDDLKAELEAVRNHANGLLVEPPTISRGAQTTLTTYRTLVTEFCAEFEGWSKEDRERHTTDLLNRTATLGVLLDRELAGLEPDAGTLV